GVRVRPRPTSCAPSRPAWTRAACSTPAASLLESESESVNRMATSATTSPAKHDAGINYELFLDCVHCGLCTSACPTYVELGDENDSPRGRIYLMRALTDGRIELNDQVRRHLDLCLDCRACESACPSGVQYGKLIEPFRISDASQKRPTLLRSVANRLLFGVTTHARRMRWALVPARLLQRLCLDGWLARILPRGLRRLYDMVPPLEPHHGALPEVLPALGRRRARVALFTGCAADAFFPQTNLHTARVLQHNGCEVWIPRRQVCCGALHYHAGLERPARELAIKNLAAFDESFDAIITNAAGCGALLKDYAHLTDDTEHADAGRRFAAKVRDISEFLIEL